MCVLCDMRWHTNENRIFRGFTRTRLSCVCSTCGVNEQPVNNCKGRRGSKTVRRSNLLRPDGPTVHSTCRKTFTRHDDDSGAQKKTKAVSGCWTRRGNVETRCGSGLFLQSSRGRDGQGCPKVTKVKKKNKTNKRNNVPTPHTVRINRVCGYQ